MIINHNKEKLYNAIIYLCKHTKFCNKTKLMKLLYYLDFFHFKEIGASVTGLDYYAWDFGPYPLELAKKMDNNDPELNSYIAIVKEKEESFIKILPKKKFNNHFFSKREMRILENVTFIFKEAKAKDMKDVSHLPNEPWDKTVKEKGEKEKIDYFLALDESSPDKEEIIEDLNDKLEIQRVFK